MQSATDKKQKPDIQKTPLHLDNQHIVIGCLLYYFDTLPAKGEIAPARYYMQHLKPEFFTDKLALKTFKTIQELVVKNVPVAPETVYPYVKTEQNISVYLSQFTKWLDVNHLVNFDYYVRQLNAGFVKRKLAKIGTELKELETAEIHDTESVLESAEATLLALSDTKEKISELQLAGLGVQNVCTEMLSNQTGLTGIDTGFKFLNWKLKGFRPGELILLAARPSVGKTAFAISIAEKLAQMGKKIAFFSLEMNQKELLKRLIISVACITEKDALHFKEKIQASAKQIEKLKIYIDSDTHVSAVDILTKAKTLQKRVGLDCVIIDYIGLMAPIQKNQNRNIEISETSRALKLAARELNVPIICLSQLNRDIEKRTEKRPVLSDLRDSGSLEQDADIVAFLHRLKPRDNLEAYGEEAVEVIIAKNRNGAIGYTTMDFQPDTFIFRERG